MREEQFKLLRRARYAIWHSDGSGCFLSSTSPPPLGGVIQETEVVMRWTASTRPDARREPGVYEVVREGSANRFYLSLIAKS